MNEWRVRRCNSRLVRDVISRAPKMLGEIKR